MFNIEINYTTGDSYSNHEETATLDFCFKKIETAKENIDRIIEHYEAYLKNNYAEKMVLNKLYKNERWFVKNTLSSIKLVNDNGEDFIYCTGNGVAFLKV